MPTTDVTNTLTATITSSEQSTGNVDINRSLGNLAFASDYGQFSTYVPLIAGANVITIPSGNCTQVYVKNIDPTILVTVHLTATATAGTTTSAPIYPGGVWLTWGDPGVGTTPGYNVFSLTSSGIGVVEVFIGG
jgi:hypothetical protein